MRRNKRKSKFTDKLKRLRKFSFQNRRKHIKQEKLFLKAYEELCFRNRRKPKITHQKVIGNFIVDFFLRDKNVVVEIDGKYHENPEQKSYDLNRQAFLESLGLKVVRFTNDDVDRDVESCVLKIYNLPKRRVFNLIRKVNKDYDLGKDTVHTRNIRKILKGEAIANRPENKSMTNNAENIKDLIDMKDKPYYKEWIKRQDDSQSWFMKLKF